MEKESDNIITHLAINRELCGTPQYTKNGKSSVKLKTTPEMGADDTGLVHGGFIFGLADYAAMIAVNHPHVVLGSSEVKFLKPVRVNDTLFAEAETTSGQGKKRMVSVTVTRDSDPVFTGQFTCFVLENHVLGK
ncbi:MAG: thioesterase [Proteobacteria bacterium]|nr:thioesterase [Pseudomonadota bacterium]